MSDHTLPAHASVSDRYSHIDAGMSAQLSVFFSLLGAMALSALLGYILFLKPLLQEYGG